MIKHSTADIYIDERGIVWFKFKENAEITLEHGYEYVEIIDKLCAGIPRPFILDTRKTFAAVSPENRKFMGHDQNALKWRKADALLIDSLATRLLGNFYMKLDTPEHPVKLFTNEKDAIEWLSKF